MDIEKLARAFLDNRQRVFPLEIDGERVWVKRTAKNLPNRAAWLIYQAVSKITGRTRQSQTHHEIACLAALRRHGFRTPDVLFQNGYYIVLSDIGPSLEIAIRGADLAERRRIVRKAGEALRRLHDAGRWHGAARLHNMTLSGEEIGFIDLENTVENWLPLAGRKFWDLWQLGHSAAFFEPNVALAEEALRAYGPSPVRRALWLAAAALAGPYLLMKPFRNSRIRELRQSHACMGAIYRIGGAAKDR